MGQIISCFRDGCQKFRRRKLSSSSGSASSSQQIGSSNSFSSNVIDKTDHRSVLIEEQDDPNEVLHKNKPSHSLSQNFEVAPQKSPELSVVVQPSATVSGGSIGAVPAPGDTIGSRSSNRSAKVRPRSPSPSREVSAKKSKQEDYLNFPIFEDQATKDYILKSKIMIIMRGLPGAGKSYLTEKLIDNFGDKVVECSADLFFFKPNGRYEFDPTLLKDAHSFCFESAKHETSVVGRPLVIINNTNVKFWEFKRYLLLASDHNYTTLIMEPKTPWAWNSPLLAQKNVHGVNEEIICKKLSSYETIAPIYFAWFLNPRDSSELLVRAFACLREVVGDERLRRPLALGCLATAPHFLQGGEGAPRAYYSLSGREGTFKSLHCTAMFSNRGKRPGAKEYSQRPAVEQNMGKVFTLKVTDVVITPRTVCARVALSPEQLLLWGQDDQSDVPEAFAGLYASTSEDGDAATPDAGLMESVLLEQVNSDLGLGDQDGSLSTLRTTDQDCLHGLAQGGSDRGRRAHITLAVGPGVSPVVAGFDLLHLMTLRDQGLSDGAQASCCEPRSVQLECGVLTQYKEGVFVVQLNKSVEMTALFSAYH